MQIKVKWYPRGTEKKISRQWLLSGKGSSPYKSSCCLFSAPGEEANLGVQAASLHYKSLPCPAPDNYYCPWTTKYCCWTTKYLFILLQCITSAFPGCILVWILQHKSAVENLLSQQIWKVPRFIYETDIQILDNIIITSQGQSVFLSWPMSGLT